MEGGFDILEPSYEGGYDPSNNSPLGGDYSGGTIAASWGASGVVELVLLIFLVIMMIILLGMVDNSRVKIAGGVALGAYLVYQIGAVVVAWLSARTEFKSIVERDLSRSAELFGPKPVATQNNAAAQQAQGP